MNLRTHLRAERGRRGHKQADAARTIGVSRKALSLWESGSTFPAVDNLTAVADYLGLSELDVETMRPNEVQP